MDTPPSPNGALRLAALGDPHFTRSSAGSLLPVFRDIPAHADVLLLCGDLTGHGQPEEARILARDLSMGINIPMVAVLGNHDYELGKEEEIVQILRDVGVVVLDGDTCVIRGVGFAGAKGFGGGFGRRALQAWGEPAIKRFVHEGIEEALKLESALASLRTEQRIALLHYSPIPSTVQGEPPEVHPFLGSSRLEEPLNRYRVSAAFHGHAHRGAPEGRTTSGVPVFNVAMPVLERAFPDRPPFRVLDLAALKEVSRAG